MYIIITRDNVLNRDEVHVTSSLVGCVDKPMIDRLRRGWTRIYKIERDLPHDDPDVVHAFNLTQKTRKKDELDRKLRKIEGLQEEINNLYRDIREL